MKLTNLVFILCVASILILGCTQNNKVSILGVWEADQVTQREGHDEEEFLLKYNQLEITETNIHAVSFPVLITSKGKSGQENIIEEKQDMKYEWKEKNKLLIEDSLYEIEIIKNEMIIKNEATEIHYNKQSSTSKK